MAFCRPTVLDLLGARPSVSVSMEPNDADWYANLLWLDRRKCLLLVHAGTLFSVFAPDVRKAHLAPIGPLVVRLIERELHAEDLPLDCFGDLDPGAVTLAKTASRTVLGYMNEIARYCDFAIADRGGLDRCDIKSLNCELRGELHVSRPPPGYFVPINLVLEKSRPERSAEKQPDLKIMN